MCMACNNRLCVVCRRRYGEHRFGDNACPGDERGSYRETTFKKLERKPAAPPAKEES